MTPEIKLVGIGVGFSFFLLTPPTLPLIKQFPLRRSEISPIMDFGILFISRRNSKKGDVPKSYVLGPELDFASSY